MPYSIDLSGRVAVVTGGSRGIGLAIAETLASHGCNLVVNGVSNVERLGDITSTLSAKHGLKALMHLGDISDPKTSMDIAKLTFKEFKRLDVLVNNAGVLQDALIGMIPQKQVDYIIDVNVKGVVNSIQAMSRVMARGGSGSIINMASIIGRFGNRGQLVYGASKAAVIGATYSAAKELAVKNIRVNAVAPGYIDTDMIKGIPDEIHKERMDSIAMGRVGSPQDIANTVLFLSSDLSSYMTGQVLGVDGGMVV